MTSMRKPLRIRVVNYDPANEPFVERYIMKKNARNYYGPHAEGTAGGTYSGRSYLREVRRRMRPESIRTPSMSVAMSSDRQSSTDIRKAPQAKPMSRITDPRSLFAASIENSTRTLVDSSATDIENIDMSRRVFPSITSPPANDTSVEPLSELDVKSDVVLEKSMRRTTMRTREFPTESTVRRAATTTLPPSSSISTTVAAESATSATVFSSTPAAVFAFPTFAAPIAATLPIPTFQGPPVGLGLQAQTAGNISVANFGAPNPLFPAPNVPALPGLSPSFTPIPPLEAPATRAGSEKYEQMGCGFDFLTQQCKDVFSLGWCQSCEDFGNVFLHDCKCTVLTPQFEASQSTLKKTSLSNVDPTLLKDPQLTGAVASRQQLGSPSMDLAAAVGVLSQGTAHGWRTRK